MDAFEAWLEHLFARGPGEFEPVPWYVGDSRPTEWTLRHEEGDTPVAQAERIRRLRHRIRRQAARLSANQRGVLASRVSDWTWPQVRVAVRLNSREEDSSGDADGNLQNLRGGP